MVVKVWPDLALLNSVFGDCCLEVCGLAKEYSGNLIMIRIEILSGWTLSWYKLGLLLPILPSFLNIPNSFDLNSMTSL